MFANPEVSAFIDRLIGGQTPRGGAPPPTPGYRGALARGLFGDITQPSIRAPVQAPAIHSGRGLEPSLPSEGVGRPSGSGTPGQADFRGGAGETGASGLSAGIGKVGSGIEGALEQLAANKQAADEKAALSQGGAFPKFGGGVSGAASGSVSSAPPMFTRPNMGAAAAPGDIVSYIRDAAVKRGIDPDVAVKVAQSEGLGSYTGDKGSSFGPFQLHYGGVAGGGNSVAGLGDIFTKTTGLDARDPSTVHQQIDFSLDQAAKGGWGPWHGAANSGIGNFQGIGNAPPASPTLQPAASSSGASITPQASVAPPATQIGIYNGQPYTYQTQPALGPQGMLMPQVDPLVLALAGGQMPSVDPNFGGSSSGLFG